MISLGFLYIIYSKGLLRDMSVIAFQKLEENSQLTLMEQHNCVVENSDHVS
jgi:hypothetical protein